MASQGGLFRQFSLRPLHRTKVPIWGIGQFAIDGYAREFGRERLFINLPYFSNLNVSHPLEIKIASVECASSTPVA